MEQAFLFLALFLICHYTKPYAALTYIDWIVYLFNSERFPMQNTSPFRAIYGPKLECIRAKWAASKLSANAGQLALCHLAIFHSVCIITNSVYQRFAIKRDVLHAYIRWQAPGLMIVWHFSYGDILHDIKILTQTCAAASLLRMRFAANNSRKVSRVGIESNKTDALFWREWR